MRLLDTQGYLMLVTETTERSVRQHGNGWSLSAQCDSSCTKETMRQASPGFHKTQSRVLVVPILSRVWFDLTFCTDQNS